VRLAALLVIAGCAKTLAELEPYPCASTWPACPEGRACIDEVCQRPVLDQTCNDFVDCTLGDPAAVCVGGACQFDETTSSFGWVCAPGLCALPCGGDGSCPADHTCHPTFGACLHDCISSCPPHSSCKAIRIGAAVCVPDPS